MLSIINKMAKWGTVFQICGSSFGIGISKLDLESGKNWLAINPFGDSIGY